MKTTKKEGSISKRKVLVSVMLLISISITASTIGSATNASGASLFLYYFAAVFFFSLFVYHRLNSGFSKSKNSNTERKINHPRDHYHYYHKVIKKTA
jgi:NADH:ubiquinone oxidoreductase subunit 6 (subunit J)